MGVVTCIAAMAVLSSCSSPAETLCTKGERLERWNANWERG